MPRHHTTPPPPLPDNLLKVRLLAYIRVRQMATALPFPFVEGCMKRLYLTFAKKAKSPPASQAGKVSLRMMEG